MMLDIFSLLKQVSFILLKNWQAKYYYVIFTTYKQEFGRFWLGCKI